MRVIDLSHDQARAHFLQGSSYFNGDMPTYICFDTLLQGVASALQLGDYRSVLASIPPEPGSRSTRERRADPARIDGVNYSFVSNKDGRLAWRPFELMHPLIYVSLVNTICEEDNWFQLQNRVQSFEGGAVECCSFPIVSTSEETDTAEQIISWWKRVEQNSLCQSFNFSHLLHTDVSDCYGSLYTHSIAWATEGLETAKRERNNYSLLGNKIDRHISAGRYGQTNGICQGSVLMDFIAEIVLGYVDRNVTNELGECTDFRILRYRDDYRIFTNSDSRAEEILKVVSDKLREVGMRLGVAKTFESINVIEGSIKPDKIAGINLQDLGETNAKTVQKKLLRLHAFGRSHPNSGGLRRLLYEFYKSLYEFYKSLCDLLTSSGFLEFLVTLHEVNPNFSSLRGLLNK